MEIEIGKKLLPEHFAQMSRMERRFYGDAYITPAAEAFSWYERYPYTTTAATDGERIIGFVNLFPVSEKVFAGILSGDFNDKYLTLDGITDIAAQEGARLDMHLSCIVTEPAYRRYGLTRRLLRAAAEPYRHLAHRYGQIAADTATPEGAAFAERYGFRFLCCSAHESRVYVQSYAEFLERLGE